MPGRPTVSLVMATHNRSAVLQHTLARIADCGLSAGDMEIIVVDNASTDDTRAALARHFLAVRLVPLDENLGSCAKARGAVLARAPIVVFLDDDSHPRPGCISRMLEHLADEPRLGAAGCRVHLPDGRCESSALPSVFVGCGVGLRRAALEAVGGLDESFFMQAEEYDLSFRLVNAGWQVTTFPDLHVEHLKSPQARLSERTVYYDTRNNLIVAARYLPDEWAAIYREDWLQRYAWIAALGGLEQAHHRGRVEGLGRWDADRRAWADRRLTPPAFEEFFRIRAIADRMRRLADAGRRRILLADWGKNAYAFLHGARTCGLEVAAFADDRFAAPGRCYRRVPILSVDAALALAVDTIVVANASPVHAADTARRLASLTSMPLERWFGYDQPAYADVAAL